MITRPIDLLPMWAGSTCDQCANPATVLVSEPAHYLISGHMPLCEDCRPR